MNSVELTNCTRNKKAAVCNSDGGLVVPFFRPLPFRAAAYQR
ncbi:hypothetical protein EC836_10118 [Erwinia sp. JUb26]|nr:hypothetical protein EC836_10118 [Erwinia sp. JUb26]